MAREESEFVLKSDFGVTLAGGLAGGEEEEEAAGEGSGEGVGGGMPSVAHGEVNIFPLPLLPYQSEYPSRAPSNHFCRTYRR